ncbi:bacterial transcriptional activator domain-containing protein [Mucilaginibacter achroorhodeus]|nr:bacterial transcriptional activator domain-containing protein [Mucilaginibacter achroorhodeus]
MSRRTSYTVFREAPTFHDSFEMAFDLSLWDNDHLGYVFNITDTKNNSYSLTYIYNHNGSPTLNFNIDSKSNKIEIPLDIDLLKRRKWMKVKVIVDLLKNSVGIIINGKSYQAKGFGFDKSITPKITFGLNSHYSDVPKMAIKDLTVTSGGDLYHFPLDEWKGNIVHTDEGDPLGFVDHPNWLINGSFFWALKFKRNFKEVAGLNFNDATQQLLMFKSDSVVRYNLQLDAIDAKPYANPNPIKLFLGKSFLNADQGKLYEYEVQPRDTASSIVSLNLNTLTWERIGKATTKEQRHHHNMFFDNTGSNFYIFGGYGSFSYHNDFLAYNKAADTWETLSFKGDTILPRFFSGSSKANNKNEVYIFGGYGNQSGNQIVGGRHFYDLYKVDLNNRTIKKLWEIDPSGESFVSANNLIVSKDGKYFYALCYPHEKPKTALRLYKFAIKDGAYEVVSGVIPVTSERIESDFNLFYDAKQDEFICTAQEFTSPDQSSIRIYTLTAPPIKQSVYLASLKPENSGMRSQYKYIIFGALLLLIGFSGIYLVRKRRHGKVPLKGEDDILPSYRINAKDAEKRPDSVYLFGEFTAYDKVGKDITYLFSPKIKQLFILLLLNSKDGQGVVSKKISATLWPDKEITKTKNIRGVTINHLRNIIADINGLDLTFVNDTYCFLLSNGFRCDYFTLVGELDRLQRGEISAEQLVEEQFGLFARGSLLRDVPENWLDDFKQKFEEQLLSVVIPEVKRIYETGHYKQALELARIALNMDPFNDVAIKYKLKAVRRIKGVEQARKTYDDFAADYERSLGGLYAIPFDKICK